MLYRLLHDSADTWPEEQALAWSGHVVTYAELAAEAQRLAGALSSLSGQQVGIALPAGANWVAAAAALDRLGCQAFLLDVGRPLRELVGSVEQFRPAAILCDSGKGEDLNDPWVLPLPTGKADHVEELPEPGESTVVLLTSGTSGRPKAAVHTWASLASGIRPRPGLTGARMLLAYDATRYAGIQVLLTALASGARLTIPGSRAIEDIADLMARDRVEFVSGTPTFWRMLLAVSDDQQRSAMPLRQITLGGEAIDQRILDMLTNAFPDSRITHIYASTEMGVCFSVHDRREGFPVAYLDSDELPVRLKVEDGLLWIRSNRSMTSYIGGEPVADKWFNTGDAVEVRDDRVHFLGRRSSRINVGGEKVYPEEVESVLRQVDGVVEARVSAVESSIVGQLVQAEIVPAEDVDTADLTGRIRAACDEQLASYKRPRLIKMVANLVAADTMKVARQSGTTHE